MSKNSNKSNINSIIIFKKNLSFGRLSASLDKKMLETCFVDTGILEQLLDCDEPKSILLGRTGSGKSALLDKIILDEKNAIRIDPDQLSLNYLANSDILKKLENIGIHLNLFYKHLWRHIFAIEIIKKRYNVDSKYSWESIKNNIFSKLDKKTKKALDYLSKWNDSFWSTMEERTKDVIEKLSLEISSKIGIEKIIGLGSGVNFSNEERESIINQCHEVVNSDQIVDLRSIDEIITQIASENKYKNYYIIIDDLDQN